MKESLKRVRGENKKGFKARLEKVLRKEEGSDSYTEPTIYQSLSQELNMLSPLFPHNFM